MERLPDEILVKIFSQLNWKDRLSADSASFRWSAVMPFKAHELDLISAVFGEPGRTMDTFPLTDEVRKLISRSGSTLSRVSFGHHNLLVTPISIELLAQHCPNLAHLDLSFCTVTERIIPAITHMAQRLKSLNLANTVFSIWNKDCHRTNMCVLFSSLVNLESINLTNTSSENFLAIQYLSTTIKCANFNACSPIRPWTLVEFISRSTGLEELHLSTYISLDEMLLDCICSLRSLKVFEWSHVSFGQLIGHGGEWLVDLQKLSELCHLSELYLQHNHQILEEDLELLCENCVDLKVLNVSYCRNLTYLEPLLQLKQLQKLYVAATPYFVDGLAIQLAQKGHMTVFHAVACPLTDDISAAIGCCKGLVDINLSLCDEVGDAVLRQLSSNCPALQRLSMQGCRLSDAGIFSATGDSCFHHLRHLDVSFCGNISDTGIASICRLLRKQQASAASSPSGETVHVFCHQTKCTKAVAKQLEQECQNVKIRLF